ncbi:hypothetical protein N7492_003320 [Penicillium capsulatum]|uniref:Uncharacterized protein n=1 Tax=Penicillium capsulatum TaxID=69766 RepID=A0A9W9IKC8_9EURO|nr:hypothetical protein N7492_003320 [Penicillium capsulatum]KAJ6122097.1 hypothetical protein N7512_004562 [Penicillium capsulatum]
MGLFHTDKAPFIRIIPAAATNPRHMALLQESYAQLFNFKLEDDISRYTSSEFKQALLALIKGPIWLDVERLHNLMSLPPITEQQIFTEIIFSRSSSRLKEIQTLYDQLHKRIWLNGKNMDDVSAICARSSPERLAAVIDAFEARYLVSLQEFVKSKIDGDYQETISSLLSWTDDPMKFTRDVLIKLWPIYKDRPGRDTWTITHTLIWGHFNPTLFRVGKMRLRYSGYFLRDELERGLFDNSYRKLMLRLCDGDYGG